MKLLSGRYVIVAVATVLLLGFGVATPAAAQPADVGVTTLTTGRLGAIVAALVGLAGVIIGGLALRSAGRVGTDTGKGKPVLALVAGLIGMTLGGLVVVSADGGLGTGNGLGGGVVALVVGLISTLLGGLARARSRRTGSRGNEAARF
ncbi:MAG TPA: DUF6223 family protein [Polyangiaceae bacterium]|nr:DUF6223 family protein [Polyangiaceae bacterium]